MNHKIAITAVCAAITLGLVGTASAAADVNGGSSWGGWTLQGRSDATGIYGTGTIDSARISL